MNKDFYDDMMETFLDEVFENEALLKQEEWIELVAEKQSYLFDPKKIRKEMGINWIV